MKIVSRRDAVKLAASMSAGAGMLAAQVALGQEPNKVADLKQAEDARLKAEVQNPSIFMFAEQVTFQTSTTEPRSFNLVITSALDESNNSTTVDVRPGTMRIFRADASKDDFTKKGGVYWKCGKTEGKFQFKEPGA